MITSVGARCETPTLPQTKSGIHYYDHTETAPSTALSPVGVLAMGNMPPVDDTGRVERLLAQLEDRSKALVPYGYYGNLQQNAGRQSNTTLIACTMAALWLGTLVFALAYLRYASYSSQIADQRPVAASRVISSTPDPQEEEVTAANSVDRLVNALLSSSQLLNQLEAAMERSNQDQRRMATKITPAPLQSVAPNAESADAATMATGESQDGPVPGNARRMIDIKPPIKDTLAHRGADGNTDY
jgi:hypothetical protein